MNGQTSHAIRISEPGGPEVLQWQEILIGAPGPGEVRLRQQAIGLNFIDVYHRTGLYPQQLPFTPGVEGAGIVEAVGAGVTDFRVGERVAYAGVMGSYAEMRLIAADKLIKLPETISCEQAAAVMLQGLTVEMLIRRIFKVKSGDTILVHAAAGGVGSILCQWAKALGATVIGTVGDEVKAEQARAHGCDHPIIYTRQDFVAEVVRLTGGDKVPVVYDGVGRDTFMQSLDCLAVRGMMVSYGNASGPVEPFPASLLAQRGSLFLTRPMLFDYLMTTSELKDASDALFGVIASGAVKIDVKQRFPLRDVAEAHRALEARQTSGSTVLTV